MKKHHAAAAMLLVGCASAYAQQDEVDEALQLATGGGGGGGSSVMLYGVIDANVEYLSHAAKGGSGSLVQMNSGGIHNSRFGVRGTEDLGGGNAAWFVLESGFNTNDGTQATAGTLFNRTSAVGLSNAHFRLAVVRPAVHPDLRHPAALRPDVVLAAVHLVPDHRLVEQLLVSRAQQQHGQVRRPFRGRYCDRRLQLRRRCSLVPEQRGLRRRPRLRRRHLRRRGCLRLPQRRGQYQRQLHQVAQPEPVVSPGHRPRPADGRLRALPDQPGQHQDGLVGAGAVVRGRALPGDAQPEGDGRLLLRPGQDAGQLEYVDGGAEHAIRAVQAHLAVRDGGLCAGHASATTARTRRSAPPTPRPSVRTRPASRSACSTGFDES